MSKYIYSEITKLIKVTVIPTFIEKLSSPNEYNYVWAYNIVIDNQGDKIIQLLNRTWQIIDRIGQIQEVHGPGVVGLQPFIKPGEAFEYNSHVQLKTSSGMMYGNYEIIYIYDQSKFNITIPTFSLDIPDEIVKLH